MRSICVREVYAETKKADLGGVFWMTQMRHMMQGLRGAEMRLKSRLKMIKRHFLARHRAHRSS